jgi:hypothetical protein
MLKTMMRMLPVPLLLAASAAAAQVDLADDAAMRPKLEALAATGNAEAAYHLGMMHHLGANGAKKDPQRALELFRQAAEGGDPLGAYKLGSYYDGQGGGLVQADPELALKHKMVAAKAGYSLAQHDVAKLLYARGDTQEAVRWLEESARQGYPESLQALASLYTGEGKVAKNMGKSLAYLVILQNSLKGKKASPKIQAWVKETRAKLTAAEIAQAEDVVRGWKVKPSPLTLQALAGEETAKTLVAKTPAPAAADAEPAAAEAAPAEAGPAPQAEAAPAGPDPQ